MVADTSTTRTFLSDRIEQCLREMPGVASVTPSKEVKPHYNDSGYLARVEAITTLVVKAEKAEVGLRLSGRFVGFHRPMIGRDQVSQLLAEQLHIRHRSTSHDPFAVEEGYLRYVDSGSAGKGLKLEVLADSKYNVSNIGQRRTPNSFAEEQVYVVVK